MYIDCLTFVPSQVPGDPALGGWRPIPSSYYKKRSTVDDMSFCQALKYLGFELRYRQLTRAMEIMADKLR